MAFSKGNTGSGNRTGKTYSGGGRPQSSGGRSQSGGSRSQSGGGRPQSGGSRPQSGGSRPQSGGGRPQSGGSRPQSGGSRPQSGGSRPQSGGSRPQSSGARTQGAMGQTGAKKKDTVGVSYKNAIKIGKNFMYKDLRRSHCYDCDFSESNFDYASFRGAHLKSCNFYGCSFKAAEFVGSNLKKTKFKNAKFEDTVFEGANLDGVDFSGASFKNVVFVGCDVSKAKSLNTISVNIKIYDEMPALDISEELKEAVAVAMENKYVKESRVLDLKDGTVNPISMMRLLNHFEEKTIIKGFSLMKGKIDNDFCTLSYIIKFLARHEAQGLI